MLDSKKNSYSTLIIQFDFNQFLTNATLPIIFFVPFGIKIQRPDKSCLMSRHIQKYNYKTNLVLKTVEMTIVMCVVSSFTFLLLLFLIFSQIWNKNNSISSSAIIPKQRRPFFPHSTKFLADSLFYYFCSIYSRYFWQLMIILTLVRWPDKKEHLFFCLLLQRINSSQFLGNPIK